MIINKLFLYGALILSHLFPFDRTVPCYGDSIALGYCRHHPGQRKGGSNPKQVLSYLENNFDTYKGKTVIVSTGISNGRRDIATVEKQFELLKRSEAKVIILGAAKGTYDKQNVAIAQLAARYGFTFMGEFTPGPDKVHPLTYSRYK